MSTINFLIFICLINFISICIGPKISIWLKVLSLFLTLGVLGLAIFVEVTGFNFR